MLQFMHAHVITFQVIRADIEVENTRQDDLCIYQCYFKTWNKYIDFIFGDIADIVEKDSL